MAEDTATKIDETLEGTIEFVVRLVRTGGYAAFRWKSLLDALLEEGARIVGPRVFLVASVFLIGFVANLDQSFYDLSLVDKVSYISNNLGELANLKLESVLINAAPFFVVALAASAAIGRLGAQYGELRCIVHYGIGGVCLTFYPMLFIAAWLASRLLSSSLTLAVIVSLGSILAYVILFFVRFGYGSRRLLEAGPLESRPKRGGFLLFLINALAVIATLALLILRLAGIV